MKIVRLYAEPDNESHFEDLEADLNDLGRFEAPEIQPAAHLSARR